MPSTSSELMDYGQCTLAEGIGLDVTHNAAGILIKNQVYLIRPLLICDECSSYLRVFKKTTTTLRSDLQVRPGYGLLENPPQGFDKHVF